MSNKNYNDMTPFEKGTYNARKRRDRIDADAHYAKNDKGDSKGKFLEFVRESNAEKDEKLFENIIDNLGKDKKKEKPYYMHNMKTGALEDVNAPPIISAAHYKKTLDMFEDDPTPQRTKQTIALDHTANKILNNQVKNGSIKKEDLKLRPNEHGLYTNGNKSVAIRDSFMAHTFNKALGVNDLPEATPKQFGQMAERLERNRQQQGKSTKVKPFVKSFSNGGKVQPKKTATRLQIPTVDLDMMLEQRYIPEPKTEADKRFDKIVDEIETEKTKLVGLETILGRKA